ncbi:MAG: VCBS repeat-containing protein [bacterium]|nr:VCBS repeat-containing protein [bacterium]
MTNGSVPGNNPSTYDTEVGDLDGDGDDEVVIALNSLIQMFDFGPDGSIHYMGSIDTPYLIDQLLIEDFNQDGLVDLFLGNWAGMRIYLNPGPGQPWQLSSSRPISLSWGVYAAGELNGDGRSGVAPRGAMSNPEVTINPVSTRPCALTAECPVE